MMRALRVLGSICSVLYPLLVLWVLSSYREQLQHICLAVLPVLVVVCLIRWVRDRRLVRLLSPAVLILLFSAVLATDSPDFFKLYPILVSGILLVQFAGSLVNPPSVVERFAAMARSGGTPLPPEAVLYCRKVTVVWVGFFSFNIAVSGLTALSGSWSVWTWYNGCISYVLAGLLMAGEWLVRLRVQK